MQIRVKVLLTALTSLAFALVCTFLIVKTLLVGYIEKEEINLVRHTYAEALSILQREENTFQNTEIDWAQWDDAYQFLQDRNEEFIIANLQPETLSALKLDYMVFLDPGYNIVGLNSTSANREDDPILSGLLRRIKAKDFFRKGAVTTQVTGETDISGRPMFLSLSPVTDTSGTAPGRGYLLIARYINDEFVKYLEDVLQVKLLKSSDPLKNADVIRANLADTAFGINTILVEKNRDILRSSASLRDILNDRPIAFSFEIRRELYKNGMSSILFFGLIFALALLIVAGLCIFVFDRLVTHRIGKLYSFIDNIRISNDISARLSIGGKDEISRLGHNMNNMLERIDTTYAELKERDERFKRIMEATNDGFFDANLKSKQIYISPSWLRYLGYTDSGSSVEYRSVLNSVLPEDVDIFENALRCYLAGETDNLRVECRVFRKSGDWLWIVIRGRITELDEDGLPQTLVGTISDITKRKKFEEENLYLIQTDPVTTLKNRAYMENALKKADNCKECNGWIIMGDVNGLKLVNDSFGHQEGDKLLRSIGEILKKCCSDSDMPARWGGDEFLILVMNQDGAYVDRLINTIKLECDRVIHYPFRISMSMGSAKKDDSHKCSNDIIKLAEERMYRNKLLESRSTRSSIISSLEQSLHEKHIETEEHTKRIKNMCLQIGYYLGMSREELDELALLGVLHDIGKIAIPEAVLMKPGKLTGEEWEIMKTHTEIGYRIAASTPELAHIADEILSHHERYDGQGYPHGLSGNDIPKLSRLLAIVDSFDVMTHDRVYKKAMSMENAVLELTACSGKQFDPEMVEAFLKLLSEKKFETGPNESIA